MVPLDGKFCTYLRRTMLSSKLTNVLINSSIISCIMCDSPEIFHLLAMNAFLHTHKSFKSITYSCKETAYLPGMLPVLLFGYQVSYSVVKSIILS